MKKNHAQESQRGRIEKASPKTSGRLSDGPYDSHTVRIALGSSAV